MGYAHRPLGRDGKVLCYGLSSQSGCARKKNFPFSHQSRIKADGLRWAAGYEIARRGGLTSSKRIEPHAAGGSLQALRERYSAAIKKMIADCKTGAGESRRSQPWWNDQVARVINGDNEIVCAATEKMTWFVQT